MEANSTIISPGGTSIGAYLADLWTYRELLSFFVWRDIKIRYKQTTIGVAWAVIQPLLTMVVFTLFFGVFAKIPSAGIPHPLFYYSALLPWTYFANALQTATNSIVEHQRVVTKIYFPRILLPLASVLSGLVDFAIAFMILAGMMLFYGYLPGINVLLLPVFIVLAVATALGVGLWLSTLNAKYRDVRYATPFLIQLWLFASPIAYSSDLVPPRWQALYGLNPMAGVIEGTRWSLLGISRVPSLMGVSLLVVAFVLATGVLFFRRQERTIADVV